jgi:hypothetical protein
MSLLMFAIVVLIVVGIIVAICQYIPFPPPMSWLRWAIPVIALLIALILLIQRAGLA